MRRAIGGILQHLPGIVLCGAPTVNSYKRFEVGSFAPATAIWGGDNRTVAVRSLIETPETTRIELRTGAADAQPYWAIASLLAAVIAGLEGDLDPASAARATCTPQDRASSRRVLKTSSPSANFQQPRTAAPPGAVRIPCDTPRCARQTQPARPSAGGRARLSSRHRPSRQRAGAASQSLRKPKPLSGMGA
jgi:hypothetical protein